MHSTQRRTSALDAILFSYHAAGSTKRRLVCKGRLLTSSPGSSRYPIWRRREKKHVCNVMKTNNVECCRWSALRCPIICKVFLTRYNVERDCNRALSCYTNSVYLSRYLPKIWIWTGLWREFLEFKIWNFYGKKSRLWMFGVKAK